MQYTLLSVNTGITLYSSITLLHYYITCWN